MEKENGFNWIDLGDQFIILYLLGREFSTSNAKNFSIAHAFECYFKACITNKYNEKKAIEYGHEIFKMFSKLKNDSTFLPNIVIEQNTFDLYRIYTKFRELSFDKQKKILLVQHLLFLFKYCADLKYHKFGRKHNLEGEIFWGLIYPDDRYAEIFCEIRKYLNYERTSETDSIKNMIENDLLDNRDSFYKSKMNFLNICVVGLI